MSLDEYVKREQAFRDVHDKKCYRAGIIYCIDYGSGKCPKSCGYALKRQTSSSKLENNHENNKRTRARV